MHAQSNATLGLWARNVPLMRANRSLRKTVLRLGRPGSERPSACRWQVLLWLFFKRRRVMIDAIRQAWTQCNVEGREIVIVPQLWRDPWRVSNPRDDVRIEGAAR